MLKTLCQQWSVFLRFELRQLLIASDDSFPRQVDVANKVATQRSAHARSLVHLPLSVARHFQSESKDIQSAKGPVFATAIIAGTMAVKRTSELIPFCHPLPIEGCKFNIEFQPRQRIRPSEPTTVTSSLSSPASPSGTSDAEFAADVVIDCRVRVTHKTGVEMEALTGASVAALCIYDMCKALSHDIVIGQTRLIEKARS